MIRPTSSPVSSATGQVWTTNNTDIGRLAGRSERAPTLFVWKRIRQGYRQRILEYELRRLE
jgi:hypothetical protein